GRTLSPMRMPVFPNDYRPEMSPWYSILNLQLTKKVGDWLQLVAGVQNLLNFMPRDAIMRPFDPFDRTASDPLTNPNGFTFDPSYNYAPLMGRRFQGGITVTLR
ncbi:MAG: TonB-dependent receptor, partial [Bacteroidetes bacterium]|nr:TonB-dependent receptor [Bacteroidota bacterium]